MAAIAPTLPTAPSSSGPTLWLNGGVFTFS